MLMHADHLTKCRREHWAQIREQLWAGLDHLRFEVETNDYDGDTSEVRCTDHATGREMSPIRPWGPWMKAIAVWCAEQKARTA